MSSIEVFAPVKLVQGPIGPLMLVVTGKRIDGDFCTTISGKRQFANFIYVGDPAPTNKQVIIETRNGLKPGTRITTVTKDSIKTCVDGNFGDIFKYTGTLN